ncbi:MAG TPA: helicase-related protein [Aliidongia sp.]|uniref:helicase-related protein n=1 Tax=Aliidongia sp. TaxID=1914230 RepID=UPI002DDCFA63|nr:helicase-related protein [Aliidongia sp.]HEV2678286.1 helicase-related protein [Aliidongia sp.]
MGSTLESGRITAVLGPTNTGKTHLAIERMLGHASGMIGFPLRLLARENYDRIVREKGVRAVALITGEEKIVPPNPSWFVCTVESMPLDHQVNFLAIDEIQLAADPERGHIFTDRLLNARGRYETMFLGSDTIRPLLRKLVPSAELVSRPRFSTLTYTGPQKVTRLPPRSAIVAFSVSDVFELAELVRRQRGGTAVVLGALSPRARNAQVAMYQAGEVDYMVATDAIGMGLNMDLDHVAFARLTKFDGRGPRRLTAPEIAQIAGRAGRHMNDGTFGTTAEAGPLDEELVEAVEAHRFDPLTALWWRNHKLDFRTAPSLLKSLEARPPSPVLLRAEGGDDQVALQALARQPDIAKKATNPGAVRLLWEICQIPDFRKVMTEDHARLLTQIFRHLTGPDERLPPDWVSSQIARIDRVDGDIDTLVQRIAHIRTWTYITNRIGWLADGAAWQERTRTVEDKLSDALHDRITQRFVDRRSAFLVRSLQEARELLATVSDEGEVWVEGHFVGAMKGFSFHPDPAASGEGARTLMVAANRMLRGEVQARGRRLVAADDAAFTLAPDGTLAWLGEPVARLVAGDRALTPRVDLRTVDFLEGDTREAVKRRLERYVRGVTDRVMAPLEAALASPIAAAARGLVFQLGEGLGSIDIEPVRSLIADLDADERKALARFGIRFGTETIYFERLLKPAAVSLRALLWTVHHGTGPLPTPPAGRLSMARESLPTAYLDAVGYRPVGPRAIRADRLETLAAALRAKARDGRFALDGALAALVGAPSGDLPGIVTALGYRGVVEDGVTSYVARRRPARRKEARSVPPAAVDHHPFAKLGVLRGRG